MFMLIPCTFIVYLLFVPTNALIYITVKVKVKVKVLP